MSKGTARLGQYAHKHKAQVGWGPDSRAWLHTRRWGPKDISTARLLRASRRQTLISKLVEITSKVIHRNIKWTWSRNV